MRRTVASAASTPRSGLSERSAATVAHISGKLRSIGSAKSGAGNPPTRACAPGRFTLAPRSRQAVANAEATRICSADFAHAAPWSATNRGAYSHGAIDAAPSCARSGFRAAASTRFVLDKRKLAVRRTARARETRRASSRRRASASRTRASSAARVSISSADAPPTSAARRSPRIPSSVPASRRRGREGAGGVFSPISLAGPIASISA